MAVIKHFTKTIALVIVMLSAIETEAQRAEQPVLPWEEDFVSKWGLNDDIAWMAEDISEFDLNYNDGFRAGIWGLTASSARFYGLKVNNTIDERFNVRKATEVVVRYMHNLIAFNHGDTLAAITMYINTPLVEETDSIFKRPACSMKHISQDVMAKLDSAYNAKQKTIVIKSPIPAHNNIEETRRVEVEVKAIAEEQETIHIVKRGDTLSGLAHQYKVRIADIQKWNNLKSDVIKIGQKLVIKTRQ